MVSEETMRQLIITLEKLATSAQNNATATNQAGQQKKGSDFMDLGKSPILQEAKGAFNIDKHMGAVVGGITAGISTGFTLLGTALVAPITQTLQNIGKDIASGATATVEATFEPRIEARKIAKEYAEAGHPLSREESGTLYENLQRKGKRGMHAQLLMNEEMRFSGTDVIDNVIEGSFYREEGREYYHNDFSQLRGKQQRDIYKNWQAHGE